MLWINFIAAILASGCNFSAISTDSPQFLPAIDSWGKPVGVLRGSFTSFGDMHECLLIDGFTQMTIEGELRVTLPGKPVTLLSSILGTCVPKGCDNHHDAQMLMDKMTGFINDQLPTDDFAMVLAKSMNFEQQARVDYIVHLVHPYTVIGWSAGSIATLSVWLLLVALVGLATMVDYAANTKAIQDDYEMASEEASESLLDESGTLSGTPMPVLTSRPSLPRKLLQSFSLYDTLPRFLTVRENGKFKELQVLNMIRVISICWVALGHTVGSFMDSAPIDVLETLDVRYQVSILVLLNSFFSVDTFFYLSSLLVSYFMLSDRQKVLDKFSYFKYALFRVLRILPAATIVLFSWWFLFPLTGAGSQDGSAPTWYKRVDPILESCPKYWWTHLLFIANMYPTQINDECYPPYWYLSADMQLYLIAPLFILPLMSAKKFWNRIGLGLILVTAFVLSPLYTLIPGTIYQVPALPGPVIEADGSYRNFQDDINVWHRVWYQQSYAHLTVSLAGILTSYYCVQVREAYRSQKMDKWFGAGGLLGWRVRTTILQVVGCAILLATLYLPYDFIRDATRWGFFENAFYNYASRIFWSLGLALILVPIITAPPAAGKLQPVKMNMLHNLGNSQVWTVLSRLTFCVYLVHVALVYFWCGSILREAAYSWPFIIGAYGGILIWSFVLGAFVHLSVELPFASLVRHVLM